MENRFSEFYAEISDKRRVAFDLEDSYGDDEYRYCPLIKIDVFGIPEDTEDSEAERILEEEIGEGVHIATLTGHLIQNGAMIRKGLSPVQMCDDHSYLLGYAMKALTEDGAPLNDAYELEMCASLFYIYNFSFNEPYRDSEFMTVMVEQIPNILLYTSNVYSDMVVYYPSPLPYEKDAYTRIKEGFAELAYKETIERLEKQKKGEYVEDGKPHLVLSEEQLNYVMRSRNKGDTYPSSAIDKDEWKIYEDAGYREVGNSRLLCAWIN